MATPSYEEADKTRFSITIKTEKIKHNSFLVKGRLTESRGIVLEDGEIDWSDRQLSLKMYGADRTKTYAQVLLNLFIRYGELGNDLFSEDIDEKNPHK